MKSFQAKYSFIEYFVMYAFANLYLLSKVSKLANYKYIITYQNAEYINVRHGRGNFSNINSDKKIEARNINYYEISSCCALHRRCLRLTAILKLHWAPPVRYRQAT